MSDLSIEDMTALMVWNAANMEAAEPKRYPVLRLSRADLENVGVSDDFSDEEMQDIADKMGAGMMEDYWYLLEHFANDAKERR